MGVEQGFKVRGYELKCGATMTDGGRFEPTLVITKDIWPTRPRTISTKRGAFLTAEAAIESAHAQGLEWIANFG